MSIVVPAFLIALSAQMPDDAALPDVGEQPRGVIEDALDRAKEKLIRAQTYTCRKDGAGEAYAPVGRRYDLAVDAARDVLGREPNLQIRLNSCRKAGDGPRFRALLAAARRHVRKAERLIDAARRKRAGISKGDGE
jgi:hypothetical protein